MRHIRNNVIRLVFLTLFTASAGCGVRSLPQGKNLTEATLAEITNQYKRRADLIPNLVNTVKGYARHEKSTLQAVVEARAKATGAKIDASNLSPAQIQKFQAAQGGLSRALGRLMVVVEKYPDLKADRKNGRLHVISCQFEDGSKSRSQTAPDREATRLALKRYATSLNLEIHNS